MLFLICACIVMGLQTVGLLSRDSIPYVICLLLCVTSAVLGLDSIVFIMSAELMPVKLRGIGRALYVVFNCMLYASSLFFYSYIVYH